MERFHDKNIDNLAVNAAGKLLYLDRTRVNLQLTEERWPNLRFEATRELAGGPAA